MKNNIIKLLTLAILLSLSYVSYKLFKSSILQSVIISDYNKRTYSISADAFDRFDINFPNITQTTIPIKLLKGRYLKNADSIEKAIKLIKESVAINPYLKMAEGELSLMYYSIKEFDSAYIYGKDAFYSLPDNNTHRYAYFQAIVQKKDSNELDNAFELIKNKNNRNHWLNYMLSRNAISQKHTHYTDSILSVYNEKFDLDGDLLAKAFESRIINGKYVVANAIEISENAAILYNEKKYKESAELYELALSIDSFDYTYFQNAALAYANTDQADKALQYFDKVIYEFETKDGKAHFYKGILLIKLNNKTEGCKYLMKAAEYRFSGESSLQMYNNFCL